MMERCVALARLERDPGGYLHLLRSFFKMVTQKGGALKVLHGELLPLLQPCLTYLVAMLNGPHPPELQSLLLELCLTLPAQLAHLLPLLSKLTRPLVQALKVCGWVGVGEAVRSSALTRSTATAT